MKFLIGGLMALAASTALAAPADDARFQALYGAEWRWRQAEGLAAPDDDNSFRDRLPAVGAAAQQARLARWTQVLAQLDAIDPQTLSPRDQVDYAIYRYQIESLAAEVRVRAYEMPFNSDSAFWSNLAFTARRPFRTADDYRNYLKQIADVPRYFDEQIVNMRVGLKRGFSVPRPTLVGRDQAIVAVAQASDPTATFFYEPFKTLPAAMPAEQQAQLRAEAQAVIRQAAIPAYGRLLTFMRTEYVPQARPTLAAEAMPDGKAFYRAQIREYTTLDLTPEAIHATGLEEVAKIRAEMVKTMGETGFDGDFPAFLAFLRGDPRFYAKTPEELLMRAAWISKRLDGQLSRYFGLLPRNRFTIKPVPADIAPYYTAGRGGADTYLVNTYDLPSRPLYNLTALTLHESAPGHAMQLSLAREQGQQAPFRRAYISAYGEGWALYTEKLGVEMGMYETPYDRFGMLTYQMWRAARLVVDTGVHAKGWSRDQAIAFLHDNTALSRHEIETEVDRYITWPGQALSYYIGQMAIERGRAKAEAELGDRFDIRAFHDAVLGLGSVTLPVLDQRIDQFIAERKAKA